MKGITNSQILVKDLLAIHYRGFVTAIENLPDQGTYGDLYKVIANGQYYLWTEGTWNCLGGDTSIFLTQEQAEQLYAHKSDVGTYVYTQALPSRTWIIVHPKTNQFPSVTVVDSAGTEVVGEVRYRPSNTIEISFSGEFSGKAYLN